MFKLDKELRLGRPPMTGGGIDIDTGEVLFQPPYLDAFGAEVLDPTPVPQPVGETQIRVSNGQIEEIYWDGGDEDDNDFDVADRNDDMPLTPYEVEAMGNITPKKKKAKSATPPADTPLEAAVKAKEPLETVIKTPADL